MAKFQIITDEKSIEKYGGNKMYFAPPIEYDKILYELSWVPVYAIFPLPAECSTVYNSAMILVTGRSRSPISLWITSIKFLYLAGIWKSFNVWLRKSLKGFIIWNSRTASARNRSPSATISSLTGYSRYPVHPLSWHFWCHPHRIQSLKETGRTCAFCSPWGD